jgi:hypothetical protein
MQHNLQPIPLCIQPALIQTDDRCCTVVFRLRGRHAALSEFLAELSRRLDGTDTVEIVKFKAGDWLGGMHTED